LGREEFDLDASTIGGDGLRDLIPLGVCRTALEFVAFCLFPCSSMGTLPWPLQRPGAVTLER